jgi:hypothetical protein
MDRSIRRSLLTLESEKHLKTLNIQKCNFTFCFVWVYVLVLHNKGRTQIEGIWEQGAEESIWTEVR